MAAAVDTVEPFAAEVRTVYDAAAGLPSDDLYAGRFPMNFAARTQTKFGLMPPAFEICSYITISALMTKLSGR